MLRPVLLSLLNQLNPRRIDMPLFKPKSNLPVAEKARIEFHLQQIAECIGFDRFQLPVLRAKPLLALSESGQNVRQLTDHIGQHLNHQVSGLKVSVFPQMVKKAGGGG